MDEIVEKFNEQLFNCSNEIEKYKCEKCSSYETSFSASLKRHLQDSHKKKDIKFLSEFEARSENGSLKPFVDSGNGSTDNNLKCKDKPIILLKKGRRKCLGKKTHPTTSKDNNWFYCKHCSYNCKIKSSLTRHIVAYHTNPEHIKWIQCEHCPSRFKRREGLRRHSLSYHTDSELIEWLNCEHCTSKFKHKEDFKRHIVARHTNPKDIKWFHCKQCSSKFKRAGYLTSHILSRHTASEHIRWFNCEQCPSKYKQQRNLAKHISSRHANS